MIVVSKYNVCITQGGALGGNIQNLKLKRRVGKDFPFKRSEQLDVRAD